MRSFRKSSHTQRERYQGKHRFEHWYRDNSVYFITSRVRDSASLFNSEPAKRIFWTCFDRYTHEAGFVPWVTTLLDNHYHTVGYLRVGSRLGQMMRKLHGSTAWLVSKLHHTRHVPFWRGQGGRDYFDGCLRDQTQTERAYRYTLLQAVRAGIVEHWSQYPHTRKAIDLEPALRRATELNAFLPTVPYARYDRKGRAQPS